MITAEQQSANIRRFHELCDKVTRPGFKKLVKELEEETDFFTAPASTRFHGNFEGGLLLHSLNVYDEYKRLLEAYPEIIISEESVIIMTLFHDLCKVGMYKPEKRNRKNEHGEWEEYTIYTRDEKLKFGGHGSKSMFILSQYIQLTVEEAIAINCHMSCWNGDTTVGEAFEQHWAAWLLHVADESATYVGGV